MNYYEEIKTNLINNETYKKVKDYSKNRSDLTTYYNVGKLLSEAGKHYGEGIIKEYAKKLELEIGKKYSYRTLFRFKQFYLVFSNPKVSAMRTQLSWTHYRELLSIKNVDKINYYIEVAINRRLTYRELNRIIKSNEYERLPIETRDKLIKKEEVNIKDLVPNQTYQY